VCRGEREWPRALGGHVSVLGGARMIPCGAGRDTEGRVIRAPPK
jgi:hypothetical protein